MTRVRRKLIEVALPLKAINEASAKEKSIRHGHPSTLHLWWARRPLAACRAVLFAQLVDDPSSVPEEFPDEAAQDAERDRLFGIIERMVPWKNSNDEHVLRDARREIARSVARSRNEAPPADRDIDAYLAAKAPPVVDPFCGGGSIPLEAQRLGLRTHASDLNPVAVLITKALVEIPPRFAGRPPVNPTSRESLGGGAWAGTGSGGLAEDVRYYGRWMRDEAEKRIGHLYPKVEVTTETVRERPDLKAYEGSRLTVIAWLWTRTVASPNPAANGVHVPLASSFVLSSKKGREAIVVPVVERGSYRFAVRSRGITPEEFATAKSGTKNGRGANFTCLVSGAPMASDHVKAEGRAGRMRAKLMAVVAEGKRGRVYLEPTDQVARSAQDAQPTWEPGGSVPERLTGGTCYGYGLTGWSDLFTDRQLVALTTFADLVGEAREAVKRDCEATPDSRPDDDVPLAEGGSGTQAYADGVATYLGLCVSRQANRCSNLSFWNTGGVKVEQVFARQALPMVWDFCEANPFSQSSGNFTGQVGYLANVVEASPSGVDGRANQADAVSEPQVQSQRCVVATDPPYYDNIGYADLSDFFYVWLRKALRPILPDFFRTLVTPKSAELVATPHRFQGSKSDAKQFFESGFRRVMERLRLEQDGSMPLTFFYAFKQAETTQSDVDGSRSTVSTGWDTMLTGVIGAGFTVVGTWPVRTELTAALKKRVAALASSIVLVCRPRPADAPTASRREFTAALSAELPTAIRRLQSQNTAPVDLAQAAVGPGMAVFSRYARVLEADGSPMSVRRALVEINRVLDETLNDAEGDMDPDTRLCVTWFEQYGVGERPFGEAEGLFKATNTSSDGLRHAGVLVGEGGKVRLKRRDELEADWDPGTDNRLTDWECVQHLVRTMTAESGGGVDEAARLATAMGPARAERARRLAYRLHAVSERKGWNAEALAYNVLAMSWPQIRSKQAEQLGAGEQTQLRFDGAASP